MPAAIKKRKVSTIKTVAASTRGIGAFTKTSKAGTAAKAILEKNDAIDVSFTGTDDYAVVSTTSRKRKAVDSSEEETSPETSILRILQSSSPRLPVKPRVPQTPRKPIEVGSSPGKTPTKGARSLLDRFNIAQTPTHSPSGFDSSSSGLIASTPQKFKLQKATQETELPSELIDLINLHAAFLTALSIHYAHNGTHSPADLRNFYPDVARAWGKRSVSLEDIRRTLGVLNSNINDGKKNHKISRLSLSDYGHSKICIEIEERKSGQVARPVHEDLMNELFGKGLLAAWKARPKDIDVKAFIDSLPMEAITTCSSVLKISPLLAKGQRRLEDMKAGIQLNKENKAKPKVIEMAPDGRKLTLLERLQAKQRENANLPPPPSKEELARRQALQRIQEVASVLTILSTSSSVGQQRISFTMGALLGKLKDSFKTPMSKEEADTCVRLLAGEIAPAWVKIVKTGRNENLVVNRDERPTEEVIRERVTRAS